MAILLIIVIIFISVSLSRWMYGNWFNHLNLYVTVWGLSLILFEFQLIKYYPIEIETWILITIGYLSFLIGCITVAVARYSFFRKINLNFENYHDNHKKQLDEQNIIKKILWVLNIITFLVAMQHWHVVINKFGSLSNVLLLGNILYSYRVSEGIPGSIPYLAALALSGVLFAGIYTALTGKLKIVAIIAIINVILLEIVNMGRAKLLMAAILFFSGYFLYKNQRTIFNKKTKEKFRRVIAISIGIILLLIGMEFVRSARGSNEILQSSTKTLKKLEGTSFITPTIYLYITANYAVLNQYLKHMEEKNLWGGNTLSSLYRILEKFGFKTKVPTYQKFYKTPTGSNTGTFLKELHADFGVLGLLLFIYSLGIIMSYYYYKLKEHKKYLYIIIFANLQVVIVMSLFYIITRSGDFLISFIFSIIVAVLIDRFISKKNKTQIQFHQRKSEI